MHRERSVGVPKVRTPQGKDIVIAPQALTHVGYFRYATEDQDEPERTLDCAREYFVFPDGSAGVVRIDDPNFYTNASLDPGGLRVELEVFPPGEWEVAPQGGSFGARGGTHIVRRTTRLEPIKKADSDMEVKAE
jgi:hypothetical protein